ncbi:TPA: site-specific DNA-methyltransferase [Burkholderia vietnamiensis]|uniref:site-specific DNA-methyltransferase (adenine-specific) n=1 Tax=Burkholderia vietnamiensis TaxID=60552 RepID=A0AAW7SY17_BURVI|nr:site-specific DNA-methyltransferase [Burkholderia vietnamiensis]MDN7795486.1 site-specific DNA-methyltransferase [Burkholderia vietnamiensis]HDR8920144.1 site-specific DNA-methyltransferase [Burkholderia vietnamiensis]HDR8940677.1 site-specific DNA-methyltransferase [Burkholderia vietnamiensis]HDR8977916.1 site-specific DNA-methyltransferase [Burkholderia vietnamiensis]HDR9051040.1 site-specific DNA-methyltransferase [Burkholderia vietnamiensis]
MPFLDWVNKNQAKDTAREVPYHLLKREAIYGDTSVAGDNLIIQGDNLLALKALLPFYAGRVKCIFIDPPYNTQSAFEHYDDRLEHSQWLSMMYPRLMLLRDLLAEDGSIWVTIDDSEAHYLKVLMDEVFGRKNFIASNVWQKRYSRENREAIGDVHDYLVVYAKSPEKFKESRNRIPLDEAQAKIYRNPDNPKETDPAKRWRGLPMTAQGFRPNQMYTITAPNGREHKPPEGRCWSMIEPEFQKLLDQGRIYWGKDGNAQPSVIRFLSEVEGLVPWTWWPHEEVGHTDEAKKESNVLFGADFSFGTPKPERLMSRILHIASNPGDLVLDSFLGSGTTAAVAHKMGRRYIGIEMGEHARTHCIPRLEKVIGGEQGGISESVRWKGGGGFAFYTLGESAFDEHGRLSANVKFSTLAAYIWHLETDTAGQQPFDSPLLGVHDGKAYFLLYNGILGDRRPAGGNVLNSAVLAHIRTLCPSPMPVVVYGETSRVGPARLAAEEITFRQIPYDISVR